MKIRNSFFGLTIATVLAFASSPALAWVYNGGTTVVNVVQWEGGAGAPALFVMEGGDICHFDKTTDAGQAMLSMVLAAFLSGKRVSFY